MQLKNGSVILAIITAALTFTSPSLSSKAQILIYQSKSDQRVTIVEGGGYFPVCVRPFHILW